MRFKVFSPYSHHFMIVRGSTFTDTEEKRVATWIQRCAPLQFSPAQQHFMPPTVPGATVQEKSVKWTEHDISAAAPSLRGVMGAQRSEPHDHKMLHHFITWKYPFKEISPSYNGMPIRWYWTRGDSATMIPADPEKEGAGGLHSEDSFKVLFMEL